MSAPDVTTVTRAEPSTGAVAPLTRHLIPKNEDGSLQDKALCGHLWDRLLPKTPGPVCEECVAEHYRRNP